MSAPRVSGNGTYKRFYRRQHPLAICLSLSIAIIGIATLLDPGVASSSATYAALPEWLRRAFNVTYALGGGLAFAGLIRVSHRTEAAGMAILASGLLVQWAAVMYVLPVTWVTASFILALAVGCAGRVWVLVDQSGEG